MRFIGSSKNYLASLVGLLTLAGAGCGGGGGHSTRGGNNYVASIDLQSWSLYDLNGTAVTCADIAARDVVVSYYNADTGTQEQFTDTFPCSSLNGGTTGYLPAGNYTITITIYGDPGVYGNTTTVLDQVQSSQLLLSGPNTLPSFSFQINAYDLAWTISVGGVSTTCESVGAAYVELDVSGAEQPSPTKYYFTCSDYESATKGIAMGNYAIQWQAFLLDAGHHALAPGTSLTNFTVSSQAPANLGMAIFTP